MKRFFKIFIITNLAMIILFISFIAFIYIKNKPVRIDLQEIYYLKLSDNTKKADIIINDKWDFWKEKNKDKNKSVSIEDLKSCLTFSKVKNKIIEKGDTVQVFIKVDYEKAEKLGYIFENNKIYLYINQDLK